MKKIYKKPLTLIQFFSLKENILELSSTEIGSGDPNDPIPGEADSKHRDNGNDIWDKGLW